MSTLQESNKQTKLQRKAQALRANLRKRKQQQRERADTSKQFETRNIPGLLRCVRNDECESEQ